MKKVVRRALRINYLDGTFMDLDIEKATAVKTSASMINFDKMRNGKWRLIYDENLIPDFSKIDSFTMIREDDNDPKAIQRDIQDYGLV